MAIYHLHVKILSRGKGRNVIAAAAYRQQALWQQQATQAFSQGRIEKAMEAYHTKGCVHVDQHSQSSLEHLVSDWFLLRAKEGAP